MGEALDPEAVRSLLATHFSRIRSILEKHGGTVEKFIGDAVMAVFGIPELHEDDALRAVRAAAEIQAAIAELNAAPGAVARVEVRIGVNSGEVVAGGPTVAETLVTGDTVNAAARLEQAAATGEILLGEATHRLVRDAVVVEAVAPISVKGKSEPVNAVRLLSVTGSEGHARRMDTRLVGRAEELAALRSAWADTRATARARLTVVLAPAGVGKSRLVQEFTAELDSDVRQVRGRCLSYGDGITYWPIREIIFSAAGVTEADEAEVARAKIGQLVAEVPDAALVERAVSAGLGLSTESVTQDELFWAVRRSLEGLAREGLFVVFEDLHWAEPTLLDLVDYVVDLSIAPIHLCATARPELLEERPGWASRAPDVTVLRLGPLPTTDTDALIAAQPAGDAVPPPLRRRIAESAEGNPLFVEEMVGMLRDEGILVEDIGGWRADAGRIDDVRVPDSIRALLAARLDRLPAEERVVAGRASVAGRSFEASAVAELAPDDLRGEIGRRLISLVRKDLLRTDRGTLTAGDAYAFRHILIRDAAYESLPKAERADLHERFANWLTAAAGDRIAEFEEIVGYHLEEAASYERQLGRADHASALARAAGQHLMSAGLRSARRGDDASTVLPILRKAAGLVEGRDRIEVQLELAIALGGMDDRAAMDELIGEIIESAEAAGDSVSAMRAEGVRLYWSVVVASERPKFLEQVQQLIEQMTEAGLDRDLARAWLSRGMVEYDDDETERAVYEHAIAHAARADDIRIVSTAVVNLASSLLLGRVPVEDALARLADLEASGTGGYRSRSGIADARGGLLGMVGRFEESWAQFDIALDVCRNMRLAHWEQYVLTNLARQRVMAGDPASALDAVAEAEAILERGFVIFDLWIRATKVLVLAANHRSAEALAVSESADVLTSGDPLEVSFWRRGRAMALVQLGRSDEAEAELVAAAELLRSKPLIAELGMVLLELAGIRRAAGSELWRSSAEEARVLFEAKGHEVGLERVDSLLAGTSGSS
jgi:class 3 adenylate cyclase